MELVAGDPEIIDPVAVSWDGDGRMYVCQMRGYMQDLKDSRAMEKIGRVTRLEDSHGDGRYDKATVYLDHLFMPRAILTLDERVLVAEPPDIYLCRDTKGHGVADVKQSIYSPYAGTSPNPEHYANGLMWALNNWIYNSEWDHKFRFRDGKLTDVKTSGGGQWGITQDDEGRIYLSSNSDPNGWWRDTAQRLIILRGDKSVIPALKAVVLSGKSPLGRLHALWTLEGMDALDQSALFVAFKDSDPRVRAGAVRASEPLIHAKNNAAVLEALAPLADDPDVDLASQLILSLGETKSPAAHNLVIRAMLSHLAAERTVYSTMLSAQEDEMALLARVMQSSFFVEAGKPNSPRMTAPNAGSKR